MGILLVIEPNDRREMFGSPSIRERKGDGRRRGRWKGYGGGEGGDVEEGYEGGKRRHGKGGGRGGRGKEGRKEEMKTLRCFMTLGGLSVNDLVIMAEAMKNIRRGKFCFMRGVSFLFRDN